MFAKLKAAIAAALEKMSAGAHNEAQTLLAQAHDAMEQAHAAAIQEAAKIMADAKAKADALLAKFS